MARQPKAGRRFGSGHSGQLRSMGWLTGRSYDTGEIEPCSAPLQCPSCNVEWREGPAVQYDEAGNLRIIGCPSCMRVLTVIAGTLHEQSPTEGERGK
jgi:hypothetical protein